MKVIDVILALIFGRVMGFLVGDFLREWNINIGFYWALTIWLIFPTVALLFLWMAQVISRKLPFVFQAAKFILVGAAATVVDLKLFEFGWAFFLPHIESAVIVAKGSSFIIATLLKYWGNKKWAFQKHGKENIHKEIAQFFSVTLVGLVIDLLSFSYFVNILGPQFGIPGAIWVKISVIFAGIAAALWNFSGYKFLVFKK